MSHTARTVTTAPETRLDKYGYNCIARHIGLVVITCAPLFLGAGTWDWTWAWIFTIVTLIGWIGLSLALARWNPGLLNQRGKRATSLVNTKRWDWFILGIYAVLLVVIPLVAGVDYRYGWSTPASPVINWLGILVLVAGIALLAWAMVFNRFFAATVRIQQAHGHSVTTTGPYRFVRHPGYVAVILQFAAIPLALGTWVAWIPVLLGIGLYVVRTALEDRTLMAELPGYAEYARQTPFRLLPGLW